MEIEESSAFSGKEASKRVFEEAFVGGDRDHRTHLPKKVFSVEPSGLTCMTSPLGEANHTLPAGMVRRGRGFSFLEVGVPKMRFLGEGIDRSLRRFTLKELEAATDGFSVDNLLPNSPSLYCFDVYVGIFMDPESEKRVLVRKYLRYHDACARKELWFLSNFCHPNILKIIGFCDEGDGFLVTEFMDNGSLEERLYVAEDSKDDGHILAWNQRTKIMMDVARALAFLQSSKLTEVTFSHIIPSYILLDSDLNAKLSCFNLAIAGSVRTDDYDVLYKKHSDVLIVAPEVAFSGQVAPCNDVYTFGQLVLQLISGRQQHPWIERWDVLQMMDRAGKRRDQWEEAKRCESYLLELDAKAELVDPKLKGSYAQKQAARLLILAYFCCYDEPNERYDIHTVLQNLIESGESEISLPE